jgi:hypothetical protein
MAIRRDVRGSNHDAVGGVALGFAAIFGAVRL